MKFKVSLSALLLVLLGSGVLWAGDPWKEKPYTEWTEEEVNKVFRDSPWAKKVEYYERLFYEYSSRMPRKAGAAFSCTVQWASSLTHRQASVRETQIHRPASFDEELAKQMLSEPEQYIIRVQGTSKRTDERKYYAGMVRFSELTDDDRRESVHLKPKRSKQKVFPSRVEFHFDTRFGGSFGSLLFHPFLAEFYFPRELEGKPVIGPKEKKVTFLWQLGGYTINKDFDLRKMVRDGKPDL